MGSQTPADELFKTVAETLEVAQQLVRSVALLSKSVEEETVIQDAGSEQETGNKKAVEQKRETVYEHEILVLVAEENLKEVLAQEAQLYDEGTIVAIELEQDPDTSSQMIPMLETVAPYFPKLRRIVIDMSIARDSVRDILHLFSTTRPDIRSYCFKHLLRRERQVTVSTGSIVDNK